MNVETYIQPGDDISVMYRSIQLTGFRGNVVEVGAGKPGKREIIIVKEGATLSDAGAIGVREDQAVFSVRRGDSWVGVPLLLTNEEAEEKAIRNVANQAKRIQQQVPLFADQIAPTPINPETWVALNRESGLDSLQRHHAQAVEASRLRAEVERLVAPDDFVTLCQRRERYPKDGLYGTQFWRKQLEYVRAHGCPEIYQVMVPLTKSLDLSWLKYDNVLTWTDAPGGARKVRVLWVGPQNVLCQVVGEPIRDYDPKLFPSPNVWLAPGQFAESKTEIAA